MLRHRPGSAGGAASLSITDDDGIAQLPGADGSAVVQVLARTSVAHAVKPPTATPSMLLRDGDERDIAGLPGSTGVALAVAAVDVYDRGLREFPPFRAAPDPAWPLSTVWPGMGIRTPVIDIVHPDRSPARLPYVEPAAPRSGRPRIRLQRGNLNPDGRPTDPALLAHELAHALHFSLLSTRRRIGIETRYATWLAAMAATGRAPTHSTEQP
ncbi:MAG: hypothetical protein QG597_5296, partial [Actinomycetota bacterium]|nr:hypothetical protein [Actinomycetota bacterium]